MLVEMKHEASGDKASGDEARGFYREDSYLELPFDVETLENTLCN